MTILGGAVGGIFMGLSTAIVSLRWDIIPITIILVIYPAMIVEPPCTKPSSSHGHLTVLVKNSSATFVARSFWFPHVAKIGR